MVGSGGKFRKDLVLANDYRAHKGRKMLTKKGGDVRMVGEDIIVDQILSFIRTILLGKFTGRKISKKNLK